MAAAAANTPQGGVGPLLARILAWSAQDDAALLAHVTTHGSWGQFNSCAELLSGLRWASLISPACRGGAPWRAEEVAAMRKVYQQLCLMRHGKRIPSQVFYNAVAKFLPGRSASAVRQHVNTKLSSAAAHLEPSGPEEAPPADDVWQAMLSAWLANHPLAKLSEAGVKERAAEILEQQTAAHSGPAEQVPAPAAAATADAAAAGTSAAAAAADAAAAAAASCEDAGSSSSSSLRRKRKIDRCNSLAALLPGLSGSEAAAAAGVGQVAAATPQQQQQAQQTQQTPAVPVAGLSVLHLQPEHQHVASPPAEWQEESTGGAVSAGSAAAAADTALAAALGPAAVQRPVGLGMQWPGAELQPASMMEEDVSTVADQNQQQQQQQQQVGYQGPDRLKQLQYQHQQIEQKIQQLTQANWQRQVLPGAAGTGSVAAAHADAAAAAAAAVHMMPSSSLSGAGLAPLGPWPAAAGWGMCSAAAAVSSSINSSMHRPDHALDILQRQQGMAQQLQQQIAAMRQQQHQEAVAAAPPVCDRMLSHTTAQPWCTQAANLAVLPQTLPHRELHSCPLARLPSIVHASAPHFPLAGTDMTMSAAAAAAVPATAAGAPGPWLGSTHMAISSLQLAQQQGMPGLFRGQPEAAAQSPPAGVAGAAAGSGAAGAAARAAAAIGGSSTAPLPPPAAATAAAATAVGDSRSDVLTGVESMVQGALRVTQSLAFEVTLNLARQPPAVVDSMRGLFLAQLDMLQQQQQLMMQQLQQLGLSQHSPGSSQHQQQQWAGLPAGVMVLGDAADVMPGAAHQQ